MFYLPKGLLVSLERSVSLVCGNAFLTKIPWCITSQSLLKVGSCQPRYGEKLCGFGILSFSIIFIIMESVSALFKFGEIKNIFYYLSHAFLSFQKPYHTVYPHSLLCAPTLPWLNPEGDMLRLCYYIILWLAKK